MSATLDRIIEEVRGLPPAEQRQLREELETIVKARAPAPTEDELEDQFERELVAEGVLSEVKPLAADTEDYHSYQPVTVTGKPISEMIIEERR